MKILRKEYEVAVTEKVVKYYTVVAKTKKDAIRQVDDGEVMDYEHQDWIYSSKPIVNTVTNILECPLKGEGWTDTEVDAAKVKGPFNWHYTGSCKGEMQEGMNHCYVCDSGIKNPDKRLLVEKEKQYLNIKYDMKFNVGVTT